jgi:hypothetical protein
MPRTSTSSKRKQAGPRRTGAAVTAPKRRGAVKHKALRAAKADPVLTQEMKGSLVPADIPTVQPAHFSSAAELLGFMSRTARTSLSLPFAMMRCRTPFEMLDEQNKLLQSVFADFQEVSARAINTALYVSPGVPHTKVKKRVRAAKCEFQTETLPDCQLATCPCGLRRKCKASSTGIAVLGARSPAPKVNTLM